MDHYGGHRPAYVEHPEPVPLTSPRIGPSTPSESSISEKHQSLTATQSYSPTRNLNTIPSQRPLLPPPTRSSTYTLPITPPLPTGNSRPQTIRHKLRLGFLIVSMVTAATTASMFIDVMFNYYRTDEFTETSGAPVWPPELNHGISVFVAVFAGLLTLLNFMWFLASSWHKVRMLESRKWRVLAVAAASFGLVLAVVAMIVSEAARGMDRTKTVWWSCAAKEREWDFVKHVKLEGGGVVDWSFLCGELKTAEGMGWGMVVMQLGLLAMAVYEIFWVQRER